MIRYTQQKSRRGTPLPLGADLLDTRFDDDGGEYLTHLIAEIRVRGAVTAGEQPGAPFSGDPSHRSAYGK